MVLRYEALGLDVCSHGIKNEDSIVFKLVHQSRLEEAMASLSYRVITKSLFQSKKAKVLITYDHRLRLLLLINVHRGATISGDGPDASRVGDSLVHPPCRPVVMRGGVRGMDVLLQLSRAGTTFLDGNGLARSRMNRLG